MAYAQAKFRLQYCLKKGAPFLVSTEVAQKWKDQLLISSAHFFGDPIEKEFFMSKMPINITGSDGDNFLAAWKLLQTQGISFQQFCDALPSFKKPPHRLEWVETIQGIDFFDDSKATSIEATLSAVQTLKQPILLIAGGVHKGFSYNLWKKGFFQRVRCIFALGAAASLIEEELASDYEVVRVADLQEGVKYAFLKAKKGDAILLSPGCSSYDQFRDYAHRGEEFKRFVYQLKRGDSLS
jgi:UDP-N-acetylmuramoylalanine--D-glutamate ligase